MPEPRIDPLFHLTEDELLAALTQTFHGIQPATTLAQLKHHHPPDTHTHCTCGHHRTRHALDQYDCLGTSCTCTRYTVHDDTPSA